MKASRAQQLKLFELQTLDTEILRTRRTIADLPERAEAERHTAELKTVRPQLLEAQRVNEELETEISRLESDIDTAKKRQLRNEERMQQNLPAKDVAAIEQENTSLNRRINTLEDRELELMEQLEAANTDLETVAAAHRQLQEKLDRSHTLIAEAEKVANSKLAQLQDERAGVSAEITGDLRDHYEQLRERLGFAVARLNGNVSEASNMALTAGEIQALRSTPKDELMYCPQTGAILVETDEDD